MGIPSMSNNTVANLTVTELGYCPMVVGFFNATTKSFGNSSDFCKWTNLFVYAFPFSSILNGLLLKSFKPSIKLSALWDKKICDRQFLKEFVSMNIPDNDGLLYIYYFVIHVLCSHLFYQFNYNNRWLNY